MGVSALRVAACAGLLVGALMLGASATATADPGDSGPAGSSEEAGKTTNDQRPGLGRVINRIFREHRERVRNRVHQQPRSKVGSTPDTLTPATESNVATFAAEDQESEPEVAPGTRVAEPPDVDGGGGSHGTPQNPDPGGIDPGAVQPAGAGQGGGSDHVDTAPTSTAASAQSQQKQSAAIEGYPYPYYLIELRGRGGDWWNVDRIIARFQEVIDTFLAVPPEPEPAPVPGPAFRGGTPEPEPVLDALGGVIAGGGSDYRAGGFGGAPVLQAPIVAAPAPPAAAVRFPSGLAAAPAAPPGTGSGLAAARGASAEPVSTGAGLPAGGPPPRQSPASTVTSMSARTPRQGYTDYMRAPGLPQLAGAALPGVAGILLMTIGGGVIGYRQASAGQMVRTSRAARYLP